MDTTRDQILTEAAALFAERGYHGLSMRELAEAAGISKANLYHHFRNKEELFLAVLLANVERLAAAAAAAECAAGDTRSRLRLLLRGLLGQGADQRALMRLAEQYLPQLSPAAQGQFRERYHEGFMAKTAAIVSAGIERGELARVSPNLATRLLLGMAFPFAGPTRDGTADEAVELILTVLFDGLAESGRDGPTGRATR